ASCAPSAAAACASRRTSTPRSRSSITPWRWRPGERRVEPQRTQGTQRKDGSGDIEPLAAMGREAAPNAEDAAEERSSAGSEKEPARSAFPFVRSFRFFFASLASFALRDTAETGTTLLRPRAGWR